MRSFPALVVIIILIAALITVVGFIIASISHKYTDDKELQTDALIQQEQLLELDQKIFSLQLYTSDNLSKIEHQQQKLENAGYKSSIIKSTLDNSIIYDLHLEGLYGETEAITLGNEIKRKVPAIQSYRLQPVGSDETLLSEIDKVDRIKQFLTQDEDVSRPDLSSDVQQYEIQIMASGNFARIEEIKDILTSLGYKTKILTLNQGNQIIYRLRLKGSYNERDAIQMGEKLVKDTPLVTNYWLDEIKTESTAPRPTQTAPIQQPRRESADETADYEIQILANTNLNTVREFKNTLERNGYPAKIISAVVRGTTYYRLRLRQAYSRTAATEMGERLKREIDFVRDYWVVKKSADDTLVPDNTQARQPTRQEPIASQPAQSKSVNYSATCNRNSINIRSGPGTHFSIDPIGKLMRGITIFVVEEKDGWARFTITPNDESWSGWVNLDYLDKN